VLLADDARVEHTRSRVQRVHRLRSASVPSTSYTPAGSQAKEGWGKKKNKRHHREVSIAVPGRYQALRSDGRAQSWRPSERKQRRAQDQ
jgi:hypothetical protein